MNPSWVRYSMGHSRCVKFWILNIIKEEFAFNGLIEEWWGPLSSYEWGTKWPHMYKTLQLMVLFLPARFHLSPPRVLRFPAGSGVGKPARKPGDAIFKLSSSIHVSVLPLVMSYSALFRSISSMETGKHDRSGIWYIPLILLPFFLSFLQSYLCIWMLGFQHSCF